MFGILPDGSIPDMAMLTESIQSHEGLRLKIYNDGCGNLTIGYGRNLSAEGISTDEANYLLANDIQTALRAAQDEAWWSHVANSDQRARAMVEIVFNLGIEGVRGFVNATAALCRDDFDAAAEAFLASKWATQVGQRAIVLAEMIRTG